MRLIKTKPRFRCDYCRHTAMQKAMEVHEKVCWRNPNRHCELCNDKGWTDEGDGFIVNKVPCYYCKQYDATKVPPVEQATERTLDVSRASPEEL